MELAIELSIITVNYNGLKDTCALIDTIPFDEYSLEVIVVDNASKEDEASIIAERYPQVRVIRSDQNLGFAGGNNLGIKAARGKYLYLINNDTVLWMEEDGPKSGEQIFQPLIARLQSSPKAGVVCPKIKFAWGKHPIQYAGYTPLSPITVRNRAIGFGEHDYGQFQVARPTPYAHGAAMMLKRETIEKAGLMPECYFLYYEELDWSEMIRRAGYKIWYEPASIIYHKESQTTGQNSPLRCYYITRNRLLFAKRNIPGAKKLLSYLYIVGVVALRDIVKYTFQGHMDLVKAVFRGIIHFIKL